METSLAVAVSPDYSSIIGLVVDGLDSSHSRRAYATAIRDFLAWYEQTGERELSRRIVQRYLAHMRDELEMSPANINLRMVAIRRLAREAAMNELISDNTALGIERVKGVREEGQRVGNWLTKQQAEALIRAPDKTRLKGLRDRAILATLIGAGLRREELCNLTVEHLRQREGRWCIVDIIGKRNKVRTIPISSLTKATIDAWLERAGITTGPIFRSMDRGDHLAGKSISPQTVMDIVRLYGEEIGVEQLAPHDLRRTFAKLSYKGGARIDQISLSLGHESIETTQIYLGLEQDFQNAPADCLGLSL